ncbi:MAG: hypothetical protein IPO92_17385 [Saprospiraceae bacterium]|nr:hypothetical protein [Saprospiraceae bacterium]
MEIDKILTIPKSLEWKYESEKKISNIQKDFDIKGLIEKENKVSEEMCRVINVSELKTNYSLYETLKDNKAEGVFYTFDDEMEIIYTMENYRSLVSGQKMIILKTYICRDTKITVLKMISCDTLLSQNKLVLNQFIDSYSKK